MIEPQADQVVWVLGTGVVVSLLSTAVFYLKRIAEAVTKLADK